MGRLKITEASPGFTVKISLLLRTKFFKLDGSCPAHLISATSKERIHQIVGRFMNNSNIAEPKNIEFVLCAKLHQNVYTF